MGRWSECGTSVISVSEGKNCFALLGEMCTSVLSQTGWLGSHSTPTPVACLQDTPTPTYRANSCHQSSNLCLASRSDAAGSAGVYMTSFSSEKWCLAGSVAAWYALDLSEWHWHKIGVGGGEAALCSKSTPHMWWSVVTEQSSQPYNSLWYDVIKHNKKFV